MKKIFFLTVPALLIAIFSFRALQTLTVSGTITDDKGSPLANVSVYAKGSKQGVASNSSGTYRITIDNKNATLVFSSVGFVTKSVKVQGKSVINVTLSALTQKLDEVVVVTAMGEQKRENYYSGDREYKTSVQQSLQGRVPGLNVTTNGNRNVQDGDGVVDGYDNYNTESYDNITENHFLKVADNPLSTFSIDVDAASYSNVRRFLDQGQLPPAGAVRIEEMINYFHYNYPQPSADQPFSVNTEIADCPWNKDNKLVMIGLQGKKIATENLPASNLVFLIDVSGSMDEPLKLPLVQASMKMLVDQLREQDHVAIVVYAGNAGLVLPSTSGGDKTKIKEAIDRLEAGGSTAGGAGIKLAYDIAVKNFIKKGNNRVILCTDGDFNIGVSSDDDMERLIEEKRNTGVYLTVLGYGYGNYKDSKMQKMADKGNGNNEYIDGLAEAKKVLVSEFGGTLFTIAKDVKLQVEFNPAKVQGYRLIGYENRILSKEDFNNDKKDAGDMGSGHTVTALYEVIPVGVKSEFLQKVDDLKYQKNVTPLSKSKHSDEILTVKFRYKEPDAETSQLIEHPVLDQQVAFDNTSDNFRFAASVSEFGMLLRNSAFKSSSSFSNVLELARKAKGEDGEGYRAEFIKLVGTAQSLAKKDKKFNEDVAGRENY